MQDFDVFLYLHVCSSYECYIFTPLFLSPLTESLFVVLFAFYHCNKPHPQVYQYQFYFQVGYILDSQHYTVFHSDTVLPTFIIQFM